MHVDLPHHPEVCGIREPSCLRDTSLAHHVCTQQHGGESGEDSLGEKEERASCRLNSSAHDMQYSDTRGARLLLTMRLRCNVQADFCARLCRWLGAEDGSTVRQGLARGQGAG